MYLEYYRLNKKPFHVTPDPEFLYLSPSHREALASIVYGVEQKKGIIEITGEVGTGKTTILRSYLEQADPRTGEDRLCLQPERFLSGPDEGHLAGTRDHPEFRRNERDDHDSSTCS